MMKRLLQITFFLFLLDLTNCDPCLNPPCPPKKISGPLSTPSPAPIRAKCSPFIETECVEYMPQQAKFFDSETTCYDLGGHLASVINETENNLLQQLMEIEGVEEVCQNLNKTNTFSVFT